MPINLDSPNGFAQKNHVINNIININIAHYKAKKCIIDYG